MQKSGSEIYVPDKAIVSRAEAKALGLKTYFTGRPCGRGGIAERRTIDGRCQCAHCKSFNAPKQQIRSRRHRESNREGLREQKRIHYYENREAIAARMRLYREENVEAIRQAKRLYHLSNRDAVIDRVRLWRSENPDKLSANQSKRRAAKHTRLPCWYGEFDEFVTAECAALTTARMAATSIAWHVDHLIPLLARKASGLHCGHNLQVIPEYLNLRKGNKIWLHDPDQWIAHLRQAE